MNTIKTVLSGLVWMSVLLIWPLAAAAVTQDTGATGATGPQNAPAIVTFGLSNRPGQAMVPTALAEGLYRVDGLEVRVKNGLLHLARAPATPMTGTVSDGRSTVQVAVRADHHCISTSAELEAVLAWPAAQKAGQTICLNPGRYGGFNWWPHRGAFMDMQARDPITFRSTDAAQPAVLDGFFIGSTDDTPGGNVILRDLSVEMHSPTVANLSERGLARLTYGIYLGWQGPGARNVRIEDVTVRGPMGEAFKGALPVQDQLFGIFVKGSRIVVRRVQMERLMNGLHVQGRDILIEHIRVRRLWGDMLQLSPEVLASPAGHTGPPPCRRTERVVVRNNIMSDAWSNNVFHPDFIHLFASHNVTCGVREVLIEGNIAYIGAEGARQPGFPTGFSATDVMAAPGQLPLRPNVLQRLRPGTVTLPPPPAACRDARVEIGVQRVPGQGGLRLLPAPGTRLAVNTNRVPEHSLLGDWEAARLICFPADPLTWDLRVEPPGPQGIFANSIPGSDGFRDFIIRHNVLWIASSNGISIRDDDNANILVAHNSLLQPFTGDANGDGRANTHADGFNELHVGAQIHLTGRRFEVRDNISSSRLPTPAPGWSNNDSGLRQLDSGRSMAQRFTPDPRHGFMPTTPAQAIAMARPRPDGILAGSSVGAVGPTPQSDPYDWSWVPDR